MESQSTYQSQATTLAFNAAIPKLDYIIPPYAAWLDFWPGADKYRKLCAKSDAAWDTGVVRWSDLSLSEADREAARQAYLAAANAVVAQSLEAEVWRQENVSRIRAEDSKARQAVIPRALALLDQLEQLLAETATKTAIVTAMANDNRSKRDSALSPRIKLPGNESLSNLRRGIEAMRPQPPKRYVSPAARKQLELGLDTKDIYGVALSFKEADALHRAGRLVINYGQHGPRGAGLE